MRFSSPFRKVFSARPHCASFHVTQASSASLKAGLVGLPNVGKSTLFNALTRSQTAEAANFPFCTIDPNVGLVTVDDSRLAELLAFYGSKKLVPAVFEVVDIAGIVAGASKGAGLGNKFLSNIRAVDAIVHVVRCFKDEEIIHVTGNKFDPLEDISVINLELVLADLQVVEKRFIKLKKDAQRAKHGQGKDLQSLEVEMSAVGKVLPYLEEGISARLCQDLTSEEEEALNSLGLLSMKKMLYAANVSEDDLIGGNPFVELVVDQAAKEGGHSCVISAQVEAELIDLSDDEAREYLQVLGANESGCKDLVRETFSLLGLQTFFTAGPKEVRAWTIRKGATASRAAGVIHSGLEKSFIQANVVNFNEVPVDCANQSEIIDKGLMRIEGRDYVMQDGDTVVFKSGMATKQASSS
eukprot:g5545.t1